MLRAAPEPLPTKVKCSGVVLMRPDPLAATILPARPCAARGAPSNPVRYSTAVLEYETVLRRFACLRLPRPKVFAETGRKFQDTVRSPTHRTPHTPPSSPGTVSRRRAGSLSSLRDAACTIGRVSLGSRWSVPSRVAYVALRLTAWPHVQCNALLRLHRRSGARIGGLVAMQFNCL